MNTDISNIILCNSNALLNKMIMDIEKSNNENNEFLDNQYKLYEISYNKYQLFQVLVIYFETKNTIFKTGELSISFLSMIAILFHLYELKECFRLKKGLDLNKRKTKPNSTLDYVHLTFWTLAMIAPIFLIGLRIYNSYQPAVYQPKDFEGIHNILSFITVLIKIKQIV